MDIGEAIKKQTIDKLKQPIEDLDIDQLRYKYSELLFKLEKKDKIIDTMAEELKCYYMDNQLDYRKITAQHIINKFTNKVEEDK